MDKKLQSLIQYAEILGIQVEDLSDVVDNVVEEKLEFINGSLENQLTFLLAESDGDDDTIRFMLKTMTEE